MPSRRSNSGLRFRAGKWYGRFVDGTGKKVERKLSTDKSVANRLLIHLKNEAARVRAGLASETGQETPLSDVLTKFLADLQTRARPSTIKMTDDHFRVIRRDLGETILVRQLSPELISQKRVAWRAAGNANGTINTRVERLRAAIRWAIDLGIIGADPLTRVRPLPEDGEFRRKSRRALSPDEIEAFLAAAALDDQEQAARSQAEKSKAGCTKSAEWSERVRPIRVPQFPFFHFLVRTGVRVGEALRLLWSDVALDDLTFCVRAESAKNRSEDVLPMRDDVADDLESLRALHEKAGCLCDYVFLSPDGTPEPSQSNVRRVFYRILDRAKIEYRNASDRIEIDVHALRVTFITDLARSGVNLQTAQRLARHKTVRMTAQLYTRLRVEDLRGAIDGLPKLRPVSDDAEKTTTVGTPSRKWARGGQKQNAGDQKRTVPTLRRAQVHGTQGSEPSGRNKTRTCDLHDVNVAL